MEIAVPFCRKHETIVEKDSGSNPPTKAGNVTHIGITD